MTDQQIGKIKEIEAQIKKLKRQRRDEYISILPIGSRQEYRGNKGWISCEILEFSPYHDRVRVLNHYGRELWVEGYKFLEDL